MTETEIEHVRRPGTIRIRLAAPRPDRVTLAALALIAVSLVFKAHVLSRSYFIEDDFLFVGDAHEHGLTWDYLMRVHKGHLMPGALLLVWVVSRAAAYNWFLVCTVMLALQAAASAGMLVLLRRLFGGRTGILIPLAVYVFAPLTVPALSWWSAALNAVPLQVAIVFSLAAHVRFAQTGDTRHAWRGLYWALFGMAFSTKGVFLPFVTFAVVTAYLGSEGGWVRSTVREVRTHTRIWLTYAGVLAAYAVLYLAQQGTAGDEGAGAPKGDVTAGLLGWMLGKTFPTGVVGGPLNWGGLAGTGGLSDPSSPFVVGSWLTIAVVIALTCVYRRHAWRAWLIAAAFVLVADAAPTVLARGRYTDLVGAETRYVADAALIAAICLALAFLPVRGEERAMRRPYPDVMPLVAALATFAVVGMSIASITSYGGTLVVGDRIRAYLDTARASLAAVPAGAQIYTRPVPDYAVLPWNGERRLTSRVLTPLADEGLRRRMRDPAPTDKPYVIDDTGRLVPVKGIYGYLDGAEEGSCYPLKDGAVSFPVESLGGPEAVGWLRYTSERPVTVEVSLGSASTRMDLPATAQERPVYFPHPGVGQGMRVTVPDGLCLKAVAFGAVVPGP
ncbi:hypothetical protein GCM10023194_04440 [Planotetraspora phitsanulokensis]|uniref:Uncharacterized protein n=1 Tax=Planotetraspora phitsanulokensis TaxID=575192 RepID=A0A8J3XH17_9ACTN|nr:hypothetical protein [Planotetraspora phitsanulokensis]GII40700.1 hypothetical protein Pph01_57030 [Planotetraspora phitsanulokensis]